MKSHPKFFMVYSLKELTPYWQSLYKKMGFNETEQALIEPLTQREVETLILVAEGKTNQEIAAQFVIAVSTVKSHTNKIYAKLGVG